PASADSIRALGDGPQLRGKPLSRSPGRGRGSRRRSEPALGSRTRSGGRDVSPRPRTLQRNAPPPLLAAGEALWEARPALFLLQAPLPLCAAPRPGKPAPEMGAAFSTQPMDRPCGFLAGGNPLPASAGDGDQFRVRIPAGDRQSHSGWSPRVALP